MIILIFLMSKNRNNEIIGLKINEGQFSERILSLMK